MAIVKTLTSTASIVKNGDQVTVSLVTYTFTVANGVITNISAV